MRGGFTVENALIYATGGVGFGHGEVTVANISDSNTHTGWVGGAGIEWMLTQNWTAKIEYLHYDFGSKDYFNILPIDYNPATVKAGVNYKYYARNTRPPKLDPDRKSVV